MTCILACHTVFDSILSLLSWSHDALVEGKLHWGVQEEDWNGHRLFISFICALRGCLSDAIRRITLIHSTKNNSRKCELGSNTNPLDFMTDHADDGWWWCLFNSSGLAVIGFKGLDISNKWKYLEMVNKSTWVYSYDFCIAQITVSCCTISHLNTEIFGGNWSFLKTIFKKKIQWEVSYGSIQQILCKTDLNRNQTICNIVCLCLRCDQINDTPDCKTWCESISC